MPTGTPHFAVLGGFLGAGKTTAMRHLAALAMDMGIRVGVVTNDQGVDLVDTQVVRRCGLEAREVTGGCFCCRFDALLDAAESLTSDLAPELFLAEAVGSCTDLVATVTTPMRQLHGERFSVGPLSVVVDPVRARAVLGLAGAEPPDDDVSYIYRKQLEESELIVLSKCDALSDVLVNDVGNAIADRYPRAEVLAVSARDGMHMREWLDRLLFGRSSSSPSLDIDYERYAAGEARLGWLNASLQSAASEAFDANGLVMELALALQSRLCARGARIAHLKIAFTPDDATGETMAAVHVAREGSAPEFSLTLDRAARAGTMLINLRAESQPELLERDVQAVLALPALHQGRHLTIERLSAFAPGRPEPTHRIVAD